MRTIKVMIALLLALGTVIGALYLGLWVCFIGGIVEIVEAVKATPTYSLGIAFGLLRVFGTGVVIAATLSIGGVLSAVIWPRQKLRRF